MNFIEYISDMNKTLVKCLVLACLSLVVSCAKPVGDKFVDSFENQDAVDLSEVVNIYEAYSKAEKEGSEYDLSKALEGLLLFSCLNMLAVNSRFWPMLRTSTIHAGLLSIYGAISICGSDPVPVQNW